MFPCQFVQIRNAILQKTHGFLRAIEDFPEFGNCILGPAADYHDLGVSADGRQIIEKPVSDFPGVLKLIHKLFPQRFKPTLHIRVFRHFLVALSKFNLVPRITSLL